MRLFIFFSFALLSLSTTFPLFADESTFRSLLVSIEKYERVSALNYAERDVSTLSTILQTRYDCESKACIDGTNQGDSPKNSIMKQIGNWCDSLRKGETAIMYLAGHGVKDVDGKLYLAMVDFDTKNFEQAAVPLEKIRERLKNSAASRKLILLDTCFAGESKNAECEFASTDEMSRSLSEMKDAVVIASCRANEKSWLWREAEHSLFTYWLIEGLKGHADKNDDRIITLAELTEFVQEHVSWVAEAALKQEQQPMVLNEDSGKDFAFPLRAIDLSRLIDDVAEQIDLQMQVEKIPLVAITDFTTGSENSFGKEYGNLPKWVADAIRRTLSQKKRRGYRVATENATLDLLRSNGLTPDDIGTDRTSNLKLKGEDVPLLVSGRLTFIGDDAISLRAQLLKTKEKTEISQIGGTARLGSKEIALTGASGKFAVVSPSQPTPSAPRYQSDPVVGLVSEAERRETERIQQERVKPHPLSNPRFPWKIEFQTRPTGSDQAYQPRKFVFIGNDCYLPISKGEEFQFTFYNGTDEKSFARILVDGLNTLSQKMKTTQSKGAFIEAVETRGELELAPRVSLENARPWLFESRTEYAPIAGFVDANGKTDTMRRFRIVDADQSVAAVKNYTEQIGLITVGIFNPVIGIGGRGTNEEKTLPGVGMGETENINVSLYRGTLVPGDMSVAFTIRYVTPEMLNTIRKTSR